ncbi:uncharacterized protein DDB_G0271670-like [Hyposmocoma kahamanoa]|uniref:uncharacterized protein DDB_G0271670-like n=1 Tax=Hyposmocoma kahamanoa TaxID=1477025 RepID=UPI000E6DA2E1|nr:uncharacterized protein DDB_G0271670-like [Hyposmocoma kahamanoa]
MGKVAGKEMRWEKEEIVTAEIQGLDIVSVEQLAADRDEYKKLTANFKDRRATKMGSRARMLVKLCEQDSGSIEDQSSSNSFNSASVNEIHTADQTALTVTENIISSLNNTNSPPILANDENGSESETKDFSADDSGDEYKPEQSVKRGRMNSTSSSSSTSSSCSSSSSSSSDSTSSST